MASKNSTENTDSNNQQPPTSDVLVESPNIIFVGDDIRRVVVGKVNNGMQSFKMPAYEVQIDSEGKAKPFYIEPQYVADMYQMAGDLYKQFVEKGK